MRMAQINASHLSLEIVLFFLKRQALSIVGVHIEYWVDTRFALSMNDTVFHFNGNHLEFPMLYLI